MESALFIICANRIEDKLSGMRLNFQSGLFYFLSTWSKVSLLKPLKAQQATSSKSYLWFEVLYFKIIIAFFI